jgi:hypothetical protein
MRRKAHDVMHPIEDYHRKRQRAEEAEARFRLARRSVDELIYL